MDDWIDDIGEGILAGVMEETNVEEEDPLTLEEILKDNFFSAEENDNGN